MKKAVVCIISYCIMIMALLIVKAEYSHILLRNCSYGMEALIRKGEVKHLFVGSSTFRQGLDIDVLESELGDDCYILSYNGNQPYTEYLQIKKLVDNGVIIDNLYVDMYAFTLCREPGLDDEKLLMELNIKEKWELYRLLPNKSISLFWQIFVSSNNEQILAWPINKYVTNSMFRKGGTLIHSEGISEEKYEKIPAIGSEGLVDEVQLNAIKGIIALCKKNNIRICFVETPKADSIIHSDIYQYIMENYEGILEQNDVEVIRYSYMDMLYNDFADGVHLSSKGRTKYTKELISVLNGKLGG